MTSNESETHNAMLYTILKAPVYIINIIFLEVEPENSCPMPWVKELLIGCIASV